MSALEAVQAVGGGLFFVTSAVVGLRLLFLAQRNRGIPELALGLSFIVGGTIGAFLEVTAMAGPQAGLDSTRLGSFLLLGKLLGYIGIACSIFFIWWVFRRDDKWGAVLALAIVATTIGTFFGFAASGAFENGVSSGPLIWVEFAARAASPCWLGIEAGRYYLQMKRRMRLGLADPVVTARFLLWTVAACFGLAMVASPLPPLVLGVDHVISLAALVVFGFAGVGATVAYGFAFFPPAAYQRRLRARSASKA